MYHFVVEQIVRGSLSRLSKGDYGAVTGLMAPKCHYQFVGSNALGGHRYTRSAIELWFQRFLRILPGFQFMPSKVVVAGWPWDTTVAIKLHVAWKKPDGQLYENVALQMIQLKWFKAVDVLTVDDSQAASALLQELAQKHGVAEAGAAPIVG